MKTKIKLIGLISFLAFIIIVSCSNNNSEVEYLAVEDDMAFTSAEISGNNRSSDMNSNELTLERLLIKNADLRMQVLSIEETRKSIAELIDGKNIYITYENEFRNEREHNVNITIKCRADLFDNLILELEKLAHYTNHKTINSEDVTMEFIDLDSRLKTKTSLMARYHEILKQAKNVKEIMEVEVQINNLRTEIESIEARLKYIKNNVSNSTISLNLYEKLPYSYQADSFGQRVSKAFSVGWKGFTNFLIGLVYLWSLWIVLAIAIITLRYYYKKRKEKNHKQKHK